jgi:hypothetical protein
MILANDNLVGGAIVAGLLLATTIAGGANGGWFTCFFLAFDFFFSAPVTVVWRFIEAYACTCGGCSSEIESAADVGGGTIVGRLVSMTIRSGGCCIEAIRMTGLLVSAAVGSGNGCGKNQFATNSNTSSDAPTQAMYRPIGIAISRHSHPWREQTPESLIVRNWTWLLLELALSLIAVR